MTLLIEPLLATLAASAGFAAGWVAARRRGGGNVRLYDTLREANAELSHRASHDPLTGLPNRRLLVERIDRLIQTRRSRGDDSGFALLFIDLDRFKVVNDSAGHAIGDALLRAAAHRIHGRLQPDDVLARLGGDEFVVVLPAVATEAAAVDVGERLRDVLDTAFRIDVHELHVTATIGIALYPQSGDTVEGLLANADAAMYHGKQSGKDNVRLFKPGMHDAVHERLMIENGLRRALLHDEFVLHYQPKIDIDSGRVTALEALVRWNHPTLGLVGPDAFIPVAEETGLINPIGEWVLRTACRQNRAWQETGYTPLRIAVNLSARQFHQSRLLDAVKRTLHETGLGPEYLELELTESTVMAQPEESVRILRELSDMGVQIAIDDFGTGYSSLAYLRRLPLDQLKVDRAFVRDLAANPEDASIVRAVISMAHSLRLKVIAEGVETQEQLELLRSLGCDQFQGYLFSPAVAASSAAGFLEKRPASPDGPWAVDAASATAVIREALAVAADRAAPPPAPAPVPALAGADQPVA